MSRKVHQTWSAIGFLVILAFSSGSKAQTSLNVSMYVPYQHPLASVGLENWAKEVSKETGGGVKVNILKTALGQPAAQYDLALNGVADIALAVPGLTPGQFYVVEVGGVPLSGNSGESLSVALWRTYEKHPAFQREFSRVKLLGVFTTSPMHFYNSKRPINAFEDFQGLKTRVAGGMMTRIANTLNLIPVNQPAGAVHESMAGGVIDAVIFPQETLKSFNLEKLVKHATIIPGGITAAPIFLAMNRAKFEALSKANQEALMHASGERLSRITGRVWDERDREGIESLRKAGGAIATANPELTKRIFSATQGAVQSWLKEVKEKLNANGEAILATFRAEAKKEDMKK